MDNNVYKVIVGGNTKQLFGENTDNEIMNSIYFRNSSTLGNEIFVNFTSNTINGKAFNGYATQNTSVTYYDCANFVNDIPIVSYKNADYNPGYTSSNGDILSNSLLPYRIHENSVNEQKSIPTGCNKINLILVGGGGSGGGNRHRSNANDPGGGGGAAGGVCYIKGYDVTNYNNYFVTVGTGGIGEYWDNPTNTSSGNLSILALATNNFCLVAGGLRGFHSTEGGFGRTASTLLTRGDDTTPIDKFIIRNISSGINTGKGDDEAGGLGGAGGSIRGQTSNTDFSPLMFFASGGTAVNNFAGQNANANGIGWGGGGGGSGGSNQNGSTKLGGSGGKGVVVVFFRYD